MISEEELKERGLVLAREEFLVVVGDPNGSLSVPMRL